MIERFFKTSWLCSQWKAWISWNLEYPSISSECSNPQITLNRDMSPVWKYGLDRLLRILLGCYGYIMFAPVWQSVKETHSVLHRHTHTHKIKLSEKYCFQARLCISVCGRNIASWCLLALGRVSSVVCKAPLGVLVMKGLEFLLRFGRDVFSYNQASIVTVCLCIKEHVGIS